ncbi:hypothetical protein [Chroococcidiopsis sp.]|uniref:hypothetical protein n=1 Tax=Chroococcidiopsis sp. TaxID=3088168 RepID=UPI003F36BD36
MTLTGSFRSIYPAMPIADVGNLRFLQGLATNQNAEFAGLKSNYFQLGFDLRIQPIVNGQSQISSYWGLQLGGLRGDPSQVNPENYGALEDTCVLIAPHNTARPFNNPTEFASLGVRTAPYQTGPFIRCFDSNGATKATIDVSGRLFVPGITLAGSARLDQFVALAPVAGNSVGFDGEGNLTTVAPSVGGGGGTNLPAPYQLTITALNTLAALNIAPTAIGKIILYVNGKAEFSTGNTPSFSVSGTAVSWNAENAGYNLDPTLTPADEVYAMVW